MSEIDDIKSKVQRILTSNFTVRLDSDGDYIIEFESANCFVEVKEFEFDDRQLGQVSFVCPMVKNVRLTPEVFRWVALEGHDYRFGTVVCYDNQDGTGSLFFEYSIVGIDVDESEVVSAVMFILVICSDLDTELQQKFGGELFGED